MTIQDLNSRIHLPSLARSLGYRPEDYSYVKIPKFGWLGYNKNKTHIIDVHSVFPDKENLKRTYRFLTKECTDFQEFKVYYSEGAENSLVASGIRQYAARAVWNMSREELDLGRIQGKLIKHLLRDLGLEGLLNAQIGFISNRLVNDKCYGHLRLKKEFTGSLIVPSFYAPGELASLEAITDMNTPDKREIIYLNQEVGWLSDWTQSRVTNGLSKLLIQPGVVWNHKLQYWVNHVLTPDVDLDAATYLKLWLTPNVVFQPDPLELIGPEHLEEIKTGLGGLSLSKVKQLEEKLGIPLISHWKACKATTTIINGITFCYDGTYKVLSNIGELELTNFGVKLTSIKKIDNKFVQRGVIEFEGQEHPFELPRSAFENVQNFIKAINSFFLEARIGLPMIAGNYKQYLLQVIHTLNPDIKFED